MGPPFQAECRTHGWTGDYRCTLGNLMVAKKRFWRNYGSLPWMISLGSHEDKVNIPRYLTVTVYEEPTVCQTSRVYYGKIPYEALGVGVLHPFLVVKVKKRSQTELGFQLGTAELNVLSAGCSRFRPWACFPGAYHPICSHSYFGSSCLHGKRRQKDSGVRH